MAGYLIALFLMVSFLPVHAASFSIQPSGTCMKVMDAGRGMNGQQAIRFYNTCPNKVFVNACIKDDSGDVKLYKSPKAIATNGAYMIYALPGVYPRALQWTSAELNPPVPDMCTKQASTSSIYNPRY